MFFYLAEHGLNEEDVEAEGSRDKSRRCGICNEKGHNARTCSKINQ